MTTNLDIFGSFIDNELEREDVNDIMPNIFKDCIAGMNAGVTLEIHINSCGGNCTSGIAIANMIRNLNSKGVHTVCVVDGICASIATLVAMACNELKMYPQSFLMIHNPYTFIQGDAETLRKEAISLDAMKSAILSFYHEKFDLTDEELTSYMAAETWISGQDKDTYKLNATLLDEVKEYKMAAKMLDTIEKRFNNKTILERLKNMEKEEKEEKEETKEVVAVPETPVEEPEVKEEKPTEQVEETKEEKQEEQQEEKKPSYEELEKTVEELTSQLDECKKQLAECKPDEDVEKRVAKCQSTFQNKINHFKDELKAKDAELQKFKDSVSSLNTELENTKKELQDMSAAFEEKKTALAKLNASVLAPSEELPTFKGGLSKCKTLKERVEYINSGKYTTNK